MNIDASRPLDQGGHSSAAIRALRVAFLVAVIFALGVFIWQGRAEMSAAIMRLSLSSLVLSAIVAGGFAVSSCAAWRVLLRRNGRTIAPAQAARIYFLGQLGKYIPGGFWQFLAAAEMGRNAGFSRLQITASLLFALAASLTAGCAVVVVVLPDTVADLGFSPLWFIAAATIPIAALLNPAIRAWIARFGHAEQAPDARQLAIAMAISLITWSFGGLHIWLLGRGLGLPFGAEDIATLAGYYAAAWIAGFLVMIAPAGMGAREATLIGLLSLNMTIAEATIIALLSRVVMTLADFAAASITLAFTRSQEPRSADPRPPLG